MEVMPKPAVQCFLLLLLIGFATASVLIRKEIIPCSQNANSRDDGTESPYLTLCNEKLVLSLKLSQRAQDRNQANRRHQFVIVDSAFNVSAKEEVRLMRPIVVKITEQPSTLAYPFKYLFSANNRPYEIILNKKISSNYTGCDPYATYQPACQQYEHLAPNKAKNGKVITQGFCCPCEPSGTNNHRENLLCQRKAETANGIDPQATTHCLRFDPVWYSVNSLLPPIFHHKVGIGLYTGERQKDGQQNWKPLIKNFAQFPLGTHHKLARHSKLAASYLQLTKLPFGVQFPLDQKKHFLLTPQPLLSNEDYIPPQTEQGPAEFLVVNKTAVDQTGESCNKIGVSYKAFEKQRNRCHSPLNSCLENSIQEMWLEDMRHVSQGQKKEHFLSAYGSLSDPAVIEEPNSSPLVLFDFDLEYVSDVYMEIDADLLETVCQARGEIVEGVSLSDGAITEIEVHIHNQGLVTTMFTTQVVGCTSPVEIEGLHTEPIGPYASETFHFTLKHLERPDVKNISTCVVELLSRTGDMIAQRRISYQPMQRCFCIAQCACKCTSEDGWQRCHLLSAGENKAAGFTEKPRLREVERSENFIFGWKIAVIVLLLLLFLGVLKFMISVVSDFLEMRKHGGMYRDIRPPWNETGLKRACLDIWFFYYCPFWCIYLCISKLLIEFEDIGLQGIQKDAVPEKKVSEVFITTKEDTGKFLVSDSEDEAPHTFERYEHFDTVSAGNKTKSLSGNGNSGYTIGSLLSLRKPTSTNENNSRSSIQMEEESGNMSGEDCGAEIEHFSAEVATANDAHDSAKEASNTSSLSKKVIEQRFRKQKAHLNDVLKGETEVTSLEQSAPGAILASQISSIEPFETEADSNGNAKPGTSSKSEESQLSGADLETLNVLATPGLPVFFNYCAATDRLRKSGDFFSLCGYLRKSGLYYKFTLGPYNTQIFWNKRGSIKKLTTPLPISTKHFVQVLTPVQAAQELTLEPKYPCLNYVT